MPETGPICDRDQFEPRIAPNVGTNPDPLTAYILAQNKLIDAKQVINARTLPKVQMPNRNGFIPRFPHRMPSGSGSPKGVFARRQDRIRSCQRSSASRPRQAKLL
jgi:hypothetical protein